MARHRQVTLDLEEGADPIAGRLVDEGEAPVAFAGWLELAAALERVLHLPRAHDVGGRVT